MVYVIGQDGQPLMPTERHGRVRRLLRSGKAVVVSRCPFTIRLLYDSGKEIQEVVLGVDAGSRHIGLSACAEEKELYAADIELRNDIPELLSSRREARRTRRNRLRYRKPRFDNRVHAKHRGWLAPSIEQKIGTHLSSVETACRILPVQRIIVETAQFDIRKIKNPDISGTGYQEGEQLGFWNVREYVLFRDGHTCRCCHGKSGDRILNVHHIESRKTGGDAPNNLVTLCGTCHKNYHEGRIVLPEGIRRGMKFDDAAFMNILRWNIYQRLKAIYPDVKQTYGYLTKNTRIEAGLPKDHSVDARCITGYPNAKPLDCMYYAKKVRRHNRQIHKRTINKGGTRKRNQSPYEVFGFRLFDKVKCKGEVGFIFARRLSGSFDVRKLDGTKISAGISYKKLILISKRKTYLIERRGAVSSPY